MSDEERDLNEEALDMVYGGEGEGDETEPETDTEISEGDSGEAAVETETEVAEPADEPELEEQEEEAAEEAPAGEVEEWKQRFEELQQQFASQQEMLDGLLQKEAAPVDPELQKLFGVKAEEEKKEAEPAAMPRADLLDDEIRGHLATEPLQFFRTAEEVENFNAGDVNAANMIFTRLLNTAVERSLRGSVKVTAPVITEATNRQAVVTAFFQQNPHLAKNRAEIGGMVTRFMGRRPELSLAETITLLTPEINKKFPAKGQQKAEAAATARGPRGPKLRQQGGRFVPTSPKGAGDQAFDDWLAAKERGDV